MSEVTSISSNSILKDAKDMKKKTEKALPFLKEYMWNKIQEKIESTANDGLFECVILKDYYQVFSYKEIIVTFKSKGYRIKFSRHAYKNGFLLYVYWK